VPVLNIQSLNLLYQLLYWVTLNFQKWGRKKRKAIRRMIELYTWATPNGRKVSIMLEELELKYFSHPINIGKDVQFSEDFIAVNPNSKIPAIVDNDGPDGEPLTVFESAAILIYLAEKTGSDLLPKENQARYEVMQWLMLQMGGVGPMFGQAHHYLRFAKEDVPYAKGVTLMRPSVYIASSMSA